MRLLEAKKGKYEITHVFAEHKLKLRMANLGFVKGAKLKVLKNLAGMVRLKLGKTKLSIGRNLTNRIEVKNA